MLWAPAGCTFPASCTILLCLVDKYRQPASINLMVAEIFCLSFPGFKSLQLVLVLSFLLLNPHLFCWMMLVHILPNQWLGYDGGQLPRTLKLSLHKAEGKGNVSYSYKVPYMCLRAPKYHFLKKLWSSISGYGAVGKWSWKGIARWSDIGSKQCKWTFRRAH